MWRPFSDPCLVEPNPIIGRSLMKRVHGGGALQITLNMVGPGIGDNRIRKNMKPSLSPSLKGLSQMKGWPLD